MAAGARDLVAVAASAGGVDALLRLVEALPADLPATVLVGLHLPNEMRSLLPHLLQRRSRLDVVPAQDGLQLRHGQVVVAVPDSHLLVVDDHVVLGGGARENSHRPSHDAMLRSAALARGPRTVGVVLTGLLDDGAAGLACVARYGGHALVQDPADAAFPSMPRNALLAVPTAQVAPLSDIAALVQTLVTDVPPPAAPAVVDREQREVDLAALASALGEPVLVSDGALEDEPAPYGCPSCHEVLRQVPDDSVVRLRCHAGHAWTAETLAEQDEAVEASLRSALRALDQRRDTAGRLAARAETDGHDWSAAQFRFRRSEADSAGQALRSLLGRGASTGLPEREN